MRQPKSARFVFGVDRYPISPSSPQRGIRRNERQKETVAMNAANGDFSELYRNALAERDPHNKALLLRRVKEVLTEWEKKSQGDNEWRQSGLN